MKFQAISLIMFTILAAAARASGVPEHTQLQTEPEEISTKMQRLRGSPQRARMASETPPAESQDEDEDKKVTTLSSTSTSTTTSNNGGPTFEWPDQPPSGPNTPGTPLCPSRCQYYLFSIRAVCSQCDSFIP